MQNGSFGLRDEWFQPRFQQADTVCRATAVPGKVYPKWHEPMRRDVARYVSETRSCAAHRFCCGSMSLYVQPTSRNSSRQEKNLAHSSTATRSRAEVTGSARFSGWIQRFSWLGL